jgi:hypothetical protein
MLDVKHNIKNLISGIYECQKKIILNRSFIRELEAKGDDVSGLISEIEELKHKIYTYQKELKKRYQFTY